MLTTLRSAIRLTPANDGFLAVKVVDCIAQTLPGLPSDSGFFGTSFWVVSFSLFYLKCSAFLPVSPCRELHSFRSAPRGTLPFLQAIRAPVD